MENTSNMNEQKNLPATQKWIAILWPSFLVAGIETVVFFTLFDPQLVFAGYDISRVGSYSVGFFLFWGFAILPCMLAVYFAKPCRPCVNQKANDSSS